MTNPFEVIEARLNNIETLLLDLKHLPKEQGEHTAPTEPEKRLNGDKAAAEYLGCGVLTIAKLRRSGQIPFYRYGARYFYIAQQLDAALKHEARRFGELRGRRTTNGK